MNAILNNSDFSDITPVLDEDFDSFGFTDASESLQRIYNSIQSYKADFSDREYIYDE